ncbi:hypothetical protein [Sphingomonas sp. DT-204]|uniref:hypothetical protein n=1 Tax=Sphingomonas sp. DT-204 TaxID=3396166 RepID=UPI003F1C783F
MKPPLVWGAALGLVAAILLAPFGRDALGDLAAARAERDRLAAAMRNEVPRSVVEDSIAMPAADRDAANRLLAARVRLLAGRGAVLVEDAAPAADPAGLARIRVRLSGSEDAVIALADTIERTPPLARFAHWRMEASGGAVRLQGELVAPWR